MRFLFLFATCFCGLLLFAKDTPKAMLVSHNDIKGPVIGNTHIEDLEIFADGRVRYSESGNDRKTGIFNTTLTPAQLHKLTVLLNSKEMRAVPAEIPSQIKVVDFDWEAQLNIQHGFWPADHRHQEFLSPAEHAAPCLSQGIDRSGMHSARCSGARHQTARSY